MKNDSSQGGPLAGLRIIDITEVVMGPAATQMLADLGADVIKVEPPGGDMLRATGPGGRAGAGPLFLNLNRNKRSIVLDLKRPAGKEALLKLAQTADALVYNVRPQAMKRLGLDYEAVRQVNPRIVYVGTFGFSQRGRYAALRAFDDLIQAAVAIPEASVRAGSDVPRYAPLNLSDRATGLYAFGVICAALLARERTGRGQAVDVPMFETTAQMMLGDHLYGHTFVPPRGGFGYPRLLNPQRRPYATQDGLVCLVVYTDEQWKAFMRAVGEAEWFESDPRFADGESRTQHVEALYEILADKLKAKTTQEWRELLEPLGIPVLPAHTFESLLDDPHLQDIGFFQQFEHPHRGRAADHGGAERMAANAAAAAAPAAAAGRAQRGSARRGRLLARADPRDGADRRGACDDGTERSEGRCMTTVVKASRQDARLVLTIDRPERRNALNADVIGALQEALYRVKSDDTIRAVVLTGAGEEAFCAGADLGADAFAFDYATPTSAYADLLRTARTLDVPLIARVNGACMAGGMGLLAMCDLAIAAPRAIFGLPEAKVGVFPMQVLAVLQAQVPQRCLAQLVPDGRPDRRRAGPRDRPDQRGGGRPRRRAGAPAVAPAVQLAHRAAARPVCDEGDALDVVRRGDRVRRRADRPAGDDAGRARGHRRIQGKEETAMDRQVKSAPHRTSSCASAAPRASGATAASGPCNWCAKAASTTWCSTISPS